jgi:hypothetical protein
MTGAVAGLGPRVRIAPVAVRSRTDPVEVVLSGRSAAESAADVAGMEAVSSTGSVQGESKEEDSRRSGIDTPIGVESIRPP